jgi:hypothetical protein
MVFVAMGAIDVALEIIFAATRIVFVTLEMVFAAMRIVFVAMSAIGNVSNLLLIFLKGSRSEPFKKINNRSSTAPVRSMLRWKWSLL